jgi:hypothetical protein
MKNGKIPTSEIKLLPGTLENAGRAAYFDAYPWQSAFAYAASIVGTSDCSAVWEAAQRFLSGWIEGASVDGKVPVPKWLKDLSTMGRAEP